MWISRDMQKTISGFMEKCNDLIRKRIFHSLQEKGYPPSLFSSDSTSCVSTILTGFPLNKRQK